MVCSTNNHLSNINQSISTSLKKVTVDEWYVFQLAGLISTPVSILTTSHQANLSHTKFLSSVTVVHTILVIVNGTNSTLHKTVDLQGNILSHIAQSVGTVVNSILGCPVAALLANVSILSDLLAE
jgi:hypothetical protein